MGETITSDSIAEQSRAIFTELNFDSDEALAGAIGEWQNQLAEWEPTIDELNDFDAFGDFAPGAGTPEFTGADDSITGQELEAWRLWSIVCPQAKLNMQQDALGRAVLENIESFLPPGTEKYADLLEVSFSGASRENFEEFGEIFQQVYIPYLNRIMIIHIPEEG